MSIVNPDLRYADSHEWVALEGNIATVGISDHAQDLLGEVVYVELPEVGQEISVGEEAGVVESVKAASDIYAPVSGRIIEINEALLDEPGALNTDPYDSGWIFKVECDEVEQVKQLLTAEAYQEAIDG